MTHEKLMSDPEYVRLYTKWRLNIEIMKELTPIIEQVRKDPVYQAYMKSHMDNPEFLRLLKDFAKAAARRDKFAEQLNNCVVRIHLEQGLHMSAAYVPPPEIKLDPYSKAKVGDLWLVLAHGRDTKEEEYPGPDGWGYSCKPIGPLVYVHGTYNEHLLIGFREHADLFNFPVRRLADATGEIKITSEGLFCTTDEKFYGDFEVWTSNPSLKDPEGKEPTHETYERRYGSL
jgi:hypothetical protein